MLPFFIGLLKFLVVTDCLLLILIILMQRPRQEGLGAAFGSGVTDQMFGAQTTNVLQKITTWLGILLFAFTFVLAVLISKSDRRSSAPLLNEADKKAASVAPVAPPAPVPASSPVTTSTPGAPVPAATKPAEATPPVTKPAESKPAAVAPAKPVEAKPAPAPAQKNPEPIKPAPAPTPATAPTTSAAPAPAPVPTVPPTAPAPPKETK